jgi:hypothetical protein
MLVQAMLDQAKASGVPDVTVRENLILKADGEKRAGMMLMGRSALLDLEAVAWRTVAALLQTDPGAP